MKKFLFILALLLAPSLAWGQCNGVFPANTICGSALGGPPGSAALTSFFSGPNPLTPILRDGNSTGLYIVPSVGTPTTNASFLTPFNLSWGSNATPIPAGTLGSLDGYECNQTTNQTNSDTSTALGNHCFGATIKLHGGTQAQGFAITATIDTVAPSGYLGGDLNIEKNIAGGSAGGYFVGSTGSQPVDTAYEANGSFTNLFKSTNINIPGTGALYIGPNSINETAFLSVVNQANAASISPVNAPANNYHVAGGDGANQQGVFDSFGGVNVILVRRANGTAASRTGLVVNDVIGAFTALGWTSSAAYSGNAAQIQLLAAETWSSSANGSMFKVRTTPNTTLNPVDALTVQNSGGVSVGNAAADPGVGKVNAASGFASGGTAGLTVVKTVRAAGGAADCNLVFTGGLFTGGTC